MQQNNIEDIILKEIGNEGLSEEAKAALLDDIAESVQNYFIAFSYQKLSEEDKQQLETLIDAGDETGQDEFLKSKIPNHAEVLQLAVDQTIKDIKESQAELDAELADLSPAAPKPGAEPLAPLPKGPLSEVSAPVVPAAVTPPATPPQSSIQPVSAVPVVQSPAASANSVQPTSIPPTPPAPVVAPGPTPTQDLHASTPPATPAAPAPMSPNPTN